MFTKEDLIKYIDKNEKYIYNSYLTYSNSLKEIPKESNTFVVYYNERYYIITIVKKRFYFILDKEGEYHQVICPEFSLIFKFVYKFYNLSIKLKIDLPLSKLDNFYNILDKIVKKVICYKKETFSKIVDLAQNIEYCDSIIDEIIEKLEVVRKIKIYKIDSRGYTYLIERILIKKFKMEFFKYYKNYFKKKYNIKISFKRDRITKEISFF